MRRRRDRLIDDLIKRAAARPVPGMERVIPHSEHRLKPTDSPQRDRILAAQLDARRRP